MDTKIYKVWTEEFKGYYWEFEENGIYEYVWDYDCDDVEDILDTSTIRELEQYNKNAKENGGYPKRIAAECFKAVELTEDDITALKQDVLGDENDDLLQELKDHHGIENYDDLYYVGGELYYFDDNTKKLYYCESEGMLTPVGYDPNNNDDDSDDDC